MHKIITLVLPNGEKIPIYDASIHAFFLDTMKKIASELGPEKLGSDEKATYDAMKVFAELAQVQLMAKLINYAKTNDEIDPQTVHDLAKFSLEYVLNDISGKLKTLFKATKGDYFSVPTMASTLTEAFGSGLKKHLTPISIEEIKRGSFKTEKILTYFTLDNPKTKVTLQYSLFEDPDNTQLESYQQTLQQALGPYGLKVFYALLAQCDDNNRQPFFYLDINKNLDRLGHKRDARGQHQTNNRERFLKCIEDLSKVNWNIESRSPDPKSRKKQIVRKIIGPLLNITAKVETYKENIDSMDSGKTKPIRDGMSIFIHEELYKMMDTQYAKFPLDFLKLDARLKGHQLYLYSHINHQWRIGWYSYRGVIKLSLHNLIKNSGINLLTRADNKLEQVKKLISELDKMKANKGLWIGDIKYTTPLKPLDSRAKEVDRLLTQTVTITASKDHPLRESMKDIKRIGLLAPLINPKNNP
jgi:hypothetical protein